MQMLDPSSPPKGRFQLWVYRRGELIETIDDKNLVVDLAKATLAHLLGGDVANRSVTKIAFGTNGAAPASGNTTITGAFVKALGGATFPAANQVAFSFSLGSGENNGMAILEFGLLTEAGVLFARKNRSAALNKDSDLSFTGTWTIAF